MLKPDALSAILNSSNGAGKSNILMDMAFSSWSFINEYSVNKWEPNEETLSKRNMV